MENIVSSAKTDMFRIRINPVLRKQLEDVYGKNGLTLTDAVNVDEIIKANAMSRLMKELKAAQEDATIHSEDEVYAMFGVEK